MCELIMTVAVGVLGSGRFWLARTWLTRLAWGLLEGLHVGCVCGSGNPEDLVLAMGERSCRFLLGED